MGKPKTAIPGSKDAKEAAKEAVREEQAAAAMARRTKKKNKTNNHYLLGGICIGFTLLMAFLAASGSGSGTRKTSSRLDTQVNDRSFIKDTTSSAGGNFTAAASPFFNKWTFADLKWGMQGVSLSGMVGMPGAVQRCDDSKDMEGGALPGTYDTRIAWESCVSPVRDSGNCTSSYALAAATTLSYRYCVADSAKYGGLRLAPQQILSCDKKSRGCQGGGVDGVWSYIQRRGLYPEECLPYVGAKGATCKTDCEESKKLKVIDHCVLSGPEKKLKREIFNKGPIVAPMMLMDEFLVYKDGIFTPTTDAMPVYDANGKALTHAVTVLGWGKSDGMSFWIIENSWGSGWGENGYAKVAMGTVLREEYTIAAVPATQEALEEQKQQQEEAARRKEEAKAERAARDERIKEKQRLREEEARAAREAAGEDEPEDDPDLDIDLDDIDLDLSDEEEKDDVEM